MAFPDLQSSTEAISLRLPASLLAEIKALANKREGEARDARRRAAANGASVVAPLIAGFFRDDPRRRFTSRAQSGCDRLGVLGRYP